MRLLSSLKFGAFISVVLLFQVCSDVAKDSLAPENINLTYSENIKPVFDRSCVRCHGEVVQNGFHHFNLSSYAALQQFIGSEASNSVLIIPGSASSWLLLRISPQSGGMYKYLNSFEDYSLIYDWIVTYDAAE